MASKNTLTKEKANLMDARWINTPFAFARMNRDFSLLQQHVMLRVSDHLQEYLAQFFRDKRNLLPDDPLSLFDTKKLPELPTLKIPYSEFNIPVNNRKALYDAINDVLSARIKGLILKDGVPTMAWVNVFKELTTPIVDISDTEYRNGCFELSINETVAAYAFNMRLGYINHPSNIAQESTREYAPRMYFMIKHKMARGKKVVTIPYDEARKDLGVDIIDKTHEGDDDVISRSLYPQFAKFCRYVLAPAREDINRMANLNLLDIEVVRYTFIYDGNELDPDKDELRRGNPDAIRFYVELSKLGEFHKDPKKALAHMDVHSALPKAETKVTRKRGRPRKQPVEDASQQTISFDDQQYSQEPQLIPGNRVGEWQKLVHEYGDGPSSEIIHTAVCIGTLDDAFALQVSSRDAMEALVHAATSDVRLKELLIQSVGRPFKMIQVSYK